MTRVKILVFITALLLLLTGCTKTVMKVDNVDISYDMYRYFYLNYKAESNEYTEEQIKEKCAWAIASDVALNKLAQKYDVELSSDDKKSVDEYVKTAINDYGSKEAYREALESNYLTEKLFKYFYSQQLLETTLREYMSNEANNIIKSDDATFKKDLEENFMAAKQILIRNNDGDDLAQNKALAEDILAKALGGEDFDDLIAEYSEDSSAKENYVYHFTYGQMLEAFENAVKDTEIGNICSYVAESEAGYHIVMRMPLDSEYIDNNFEDLRDAYKARCFNEIRDEMAKSYEIEYSEDFDTVTFE